MLYYEGFSNLVFQLDQSIMLCGLSLIYACVDRRGSFPALIIHSSLIGEKHIC